MARARWHILRDGMGLTLCRHLPPRFDFAVRSRISGGGAVRLAHQIRQDLWRALQTVRGYSPVVRLDRVDAGWHVTAGGRAAGPVPDTVMSRAEAVLEDPGNRARWLRYSEAAR
ncbi:MAG: hypothetical protein AB3N09_03145 [Tateyamaria sp.]